MYFSRHFYFVYVSSLYPVTVTDLIRVEQFSTEDIEFVGGVRFVLLHVFVWFLWDGEEGDFAGFGEELPDEFCTERMSGGVLCYVLHDVTYSDRRTTSVQQQCKQTTQPHV